jgi:hypothetical protein
MPGKTGCAPQKLICHFTDRLIQPPLWLTHQEPMVGDGTRSGCKDRVDISWADGTYQGKAMHIPADLVVRRLRHISIAT